MDVWEKLVAQLREVASLTPPICHYDHPKETEHFGKKITVYCKPFEQFQGLMREVADYIANGVTVQEWISVKDRLPEEEGLYLVAVVNDHERRYSKTAWYHGYGNWFVHQKVTHWQHLPQPPKGE